MYRNVQLNFADISLEESDKHHIFRIIDNIDEAAPSDSSLSFIVGKTNDFVKINCELLSSKYLFSSEAIEADPVLAAQLVEKDILQKLENWKAMRFLPKQSEGVRDFQTAI